jgi:hypothetical protein
MDLLKHFAKSMISIFWKVYFWYNFALIIFLAFYFIINWTHVNSGEIFGLIVGFFMLIGLCSYAFKKYLFTRKTWKLLLYISCFYIILQNLYLNTSFHFLDNILKDEFGIALSTFYSSKNLIVSVVSNIFITVLSILMIFPLYRLSFDRNNHFKSEKIVKKIHVPNKNAEYSKIAITCLVMCFVLILILIISSFTIQSILLVLPLLTLVVFIFSVKALIAVRRNEKRGSRIAWLATIISGIEFLGLLSLFVYSFMQVFTSDDYKTVQKYSGANVCAN